MTRPGWCLSTRPATNHGAASRPLLARRAIDWPRAAGALENHHLCGGSAPRQDGCAFVVDGPMTRATFLAYLEQCLRPTLKRGDIVIIDNLPAHKGVLWRRPSNCACAAALSAEILTRSQSNRAGLQQIENASAQGCRANDFRSLPQDRKTDCRFQCQRMYKLLQPRGLCLKMTGI